jgi:hypothetical protein
MNQEAMRHKKSDILILGLLIVAAALFACCADRSPPEHQVSFRMRINSFAPEAASIPVARGEPSDGSLWVWVFVLYGENGGPVGGGPSPVGRLKVYGTSLSHPQEIIDLSDTSQPLELDREYRVRWEYSATRGGQLFIDDAPVGGRAGGGPLATHLSSTIRLKQQIYTSSGRAHSDFDGDVWDISVYAAY